MRALEFATKCGGMWTRKMRDALSCCMVQELSPTLNVQELGGIPWDRDALELLPAHPSRNSEDPAKTRMRAKTGGRFMGVSDIRSSGGLSPESPARAVDCPGKGSGMSNPPVPPRFAVRADKGQPQGDLKSPMQE